MSRQAFTRKFKWDTGCRLAGNDEKMVEVSDGDIRG